MRTSKVFVVLYFVYMDTALMTTSQDYTASAANPHIKPLQIPKLSYSLIKMVPGVIEFTTSTPTTLKQDTSSYERKVHTQKTNDDKMSLFNETFLEIKNILQRGLKGTTKEKPSTSTKTHSSTTEMWLLPVFVNDLTNSSLTMTTELDFLESLEEILNYNYEDLTDIPLRHENDKRNNPVTENGDLNTLLNSKSTLPVQRTSYTGVSFPAEELYAHTSPTEQYKVKTSNSNTFVPTGTKHGKDNTDGPTTEDIEVKLVYGDKTKKVTQNSMTIFPIQRRVYLGDFPLEETTVRSDEIKKPKLSVIKVGIEKRSTNPISFLTSQDGHGDSTVPITLHQKPKTDPSLDSLVQRRAYFGGVYPLEETTPRSDEKKKPKLFAIKGSIGKRVTIPTSFLNSQEAYEDATATITLRKELKTPVSIQDSLKIYPLQSRVNFEGNFPLEKQLPWSDKTKTTISAIKDSIGKPKKSNLLNSPDATGPKIIHNQLNKTQDSLKIFPIQNRVYFGGVFPLEETKVTSPILKTDALSIQDKNVIIKVPLSVLRSLKDILPPRVVESIPNSTPAGLYKNAFRFYKTVNVMTVPNIDYVDQEEYKRVTTTLHEEDFTRTQSTTPLPTTEEVNTSKSTVISDITVPDNTESDVTESIPPTLRVINNLATMGQVHRVLSEVLRKYSVMKLPSLNSASKNKWTINKNTSVTGHVDKVLSKILNKYSTETLPHKEESEVSKSVKKIKDFRLRNNIFKYSYRTTTPMDRDITETLLNNYLYSNDVMHKMPSNNMASTNAPGTHFSTDPAPKHSRPLSKENIPKPYDHSNRKQSHKTSFDWHNVLFDRPFSTQIERNKMPFTKSDKSVLKKYTIPIVNTDRTQLDSLYVPIYSTRSTLAEGLRRHTITEKVYETSTELHDLFFYRAHSTPLEGLERNIYKPSNNYRNDENSVYTSTDSHDVLFDTTYSMPLEGPRRYLYKPSNSYRNHKEPVNITSTEKHAFFDTTFSTPKQEISGNIYKPLNNDRNNKYSVYRTSTKSHNAFSDTTFSTPKQVSSENIYKLPNNYRNNEEIIHRTSIKSHNSFFDTTLSTPKQVSSGNIYKLPNNYRNNEEIVHETSTDLRNVFFDTTLSTPLLNPIGNIYKSSNNDRNNEKSAYRTSTKSHNAYFDRTLSTLKQVSRGNIYNPPNNYRNNEEIIHRTSTDSRNAFFNTTLSTPLDPNGSINKPPKNYGNNAESEYKTTTESYDVFLDRTLEPNESASTAYEAHMKRTYTIPIEYNMDKIHINAIKHLKEIHFTDNYRKKKPSVVRKYLVFLNSTLLNGNLFMSSNDDQNKESLFRKYLVFLNSPHTTPLNLSDGILSKASSDYHSKKESAHKIHLVFLNNTYSGQAEPLYKTHTTPEAFYDDTEKAHFDYLDRMLQIVNNAFVNSTPTTQPESRPERTLTTIQDVEYNNKYTDILQHIDRMRTLHTILSAIQNSSANNNSSKGTAYPNSTLINNEPIDSKYSTQEYPISTIFPAFDPKVNKKHKTQSKYNKLLKSQLIPVRYPNNLVYYNITLQDEFERMNQTFQNFDGPIIISSTQVEPPETILHSTIATQLNSGLTTQTVKRTPLSDHVESYTTPFSPFKTSSKTMEHYQGLLYSTLADKLNSAHTTQATKKTPSSDLVGWNTTPFSLFKPSFNKTSSNQLQHSKSILYSTLAAKINTGHTTQAIKRAPSSDLVESNTTPFSLFRTSFNNKSTKQLEHSKSILYSTIAAQRNSAHTTQAIKRSSSSDLVELYTTPFSLFKPSFNNTASNQLQHSKSILYSTLAIKLNSAYTTQTIKRETSSNLVESNTTPFSLFKPSFNNTFSTQLEHLNSAMYSTLTFSVNNASSTQDIIYSKRAPSPDRTKSFTTPFSLFKTSFKNTSSTQLQNYNSTLYSTLAAKDNNAHTMQTTLSYHIQSYTTPTTKLDTDFSGSSSTQLEKVKSTLYSTIAAKVNNAHKTQAPSSDDIKLFTTDSTPLGAAFNNSSPKQLEYPESTLYLSLAAKVNNARTTEAIKKAPSLDHIQSDTTPSIPFNALINTSSTKLGNLNTLYQTLASKVNNAYITQAIKRAPSSDLIESYTTFSTLLNATFSNTTPRKLENSRSTVYSKLDANVNYAHTTEDMVYSKRELTSDLNQSYTTPSTLLHASFITSPTNLRHLNSTLYSTLAAKVHHARTTQFIKRTPPSQRVQPYTTPSLLLTTASSNISSKQLEQMKSTLYSALDAKVSNAYTPQDKSAPTSARVQPSTTPSTQTEYQSILDTTIDMYFNSTYTTPTPLPTRPYVLQDASSNTTHKTKSSSQSRTIATIKDNLNSTVATLQENLHSTEPGLKGDPNSTIAAIKERNRMVATFQKDSKSTELQNSNLLYKTHAIKSSIIPKQKEYRNRTVATLPKDSKSTEATQPNSNSTVTTSQQDSSTLQTLVNLYEDEESRKRNVEMLHTTPDILPYKKHRKIGLPLTEAEFIREMLPQTKYGNNTCGIDKSPMSVVYEGVGRIETYPWLGVLFFPKGKQWVSTSVVLVTRNTVIGFALDIDALSKSKFRQRARVALGSSCDKQRLRVLDYNYHPEYRSGTYSTLVLVQIDLASVQQELRPICAPPQRLTESVIHAMVVSEDCKNPKMKIYEMTHVPQDKCKSYYRKSGLDIGSIWPKHTACGRARWGGRCVWRSGTALVVRQKGRWHLLGFGVHGPGCEAPARFVDFGMYRRWVADSVARVGRPAVTRLGPNHLVLRRMTTHIQRFGPCDADERQYEMFTDTTTVAPSSLARHSGRVRYNLTIFANIDYSCVVFRAFHTHKRWQGTKPLVSLRRYCPSKMPICFTTDISQIQFYIEIVYFHGITYKVAAYGREARVIEPKSLTRYVNLKKNFAVIPWPSTETPNKR